jgi:hypothetical protein
MKPDLPESALNGVKGEVVVAQRLVAVMYLEYLH